MQYFSYLMGADQISDSELGEIGVEITSKPDSDSRTLKISEQSLERYEELISDKLDPGFWNDIVSEKRILFIFKFTDGSVKRFELSKKNQSEIAQLCHDFNGDPLEKTSDILAYLAGNDFYADTIARFKHFVDPNKLSYIGVKALIINAEGKVLIAQEPTHYVGGGKWELPGGKIAKGEEGIALEEILRREIREELGEQVQVEVGGIIDVMRRPWNKVGALSDQVMLVVFQCTYRGGDIQLSEENHSFAWISVSELPQYDFVPGYLPVLEKYFRVNN